MSEFSVVSDYQTTLASPMNSSQLTVSVNSIVTRDATPVTLTTALMGTGWYLTVDPGTSSEEFVKITAVTPGSGVSGIFTVPPLGRGLAYSGSTDAQGIGNAKPHNPGAIVILSNAKNVYDRLVDRESDESVGGIKTFSDSPQVPTPTSGELDAAASVRYVNEAVVSGAPNAAVGTKGIVEIGTQLQVNTGDDSGSTDATSVIIPSTHFQTWDMVVTADYTYGDTIAVNDLVYVSESTGRWVRADASDALTSLYAFGFALDAGTNGQTGKRVQIGGIVTGLSGLGQTVYVFASDTPGAISLTPGTNKKVVGVSYSPTSLLIIPILDVSALFDVNENVTSETLNLAADFFTSPSHQGIKTEYEAGQNLAAGEVVALEAASKVFRVRPTGFSANNAGANADLASTEICSSGKMWCYNTATPTIKAFLGRDDDSTDHFTMISATVDSNFNAVSATTVGDLTPTSLTDIYDAIQHNGGTQATVVYRDGNDLEAASCNALTTTPSWGAQLSLETNATAGGITDTTVSNTLVAFGVINSNTDIRSYKITFSGTTLTESTNAAFLSGGTGVTVYAAGRFTGTDFIALYYLNNSVASIGIGQYNAAAGTWTSLGTPVTVGGINAGTGFLVPLSATKMAFCFIEATDLKVNIITRSGVTPTIGSGTVAISSISATIITNAISFTQIGKYSFLASAETSGGGKIQIVSADRDFTDFAIVGSQFTNGAATNLGVLGALLTPQRWLSVYRSAATVSSFRTQELASNIDAAIGVTNGAANASVGIDIVTDGFVDTLSGLTSGVAYYTALDGQLTTSSNGVTPLPANNSQSPLTRRVVVADSATTGQVKV